MGNLNLLNYDDVKYAFSGDPELCDIVDAKDVQICMSEHNTTTSFPDVIQCVPSL